MEARRFEITAIVPVALFVWFIWGIVGMPGHREHAAVYLAAGTLLAVPLLMLLFAHLVAASSWKRRVYLLAGDGIFFVLAQVAAFIMAWFKPGWFGVMALSACLVICCALFLIPVRSRSRPSGDVV